MWRDATEELAAELMARADALDALAADDPDPPADEPGPAPEPHPDDPDPDEPGPDEPGAWPEDDPDVSDPAPEPDASEPDPPPEPDPVQSHHDGITAVVDHETRLARLLLTAPRVERIRWEV
ncbi:hypothetical protein ACFQV2_39060 [Actinokineospora soli]|uniref:Uncharacterized protein n=1 Tax=Actinokineospora soli TaxID=1048753 RepID=A0ABW2TYQ9_9PSEU